MSSTADSSDEEQAPAAGSDDQAEEPEFEADDYASVDDLDPEMASEIADSVAEESTEDDDVDQEADQSGQQAPDDIEDVAEGVAEGDISIGHVYCRSLGLGAAAMVNRYDEGGQEMEALVDEYAALAKQTDLDQYMDQWFEQSMGGSSMTPGQGVAVGTLLFVAMVAIQNPAVADGLATEVGL